VLYLNIIICSRNISEDKPFATCYYLTHLLSPRLLLEGHDRMWLISLISIVDMVARIELTLVGPNHFLLVRALELYCLNDNKGWLPYQELGP
jgi:hypothetical protein